MKVWVTEIHKAVPRFFKAFAERLRESDSREALGMTGASGPALARLITSDVADSIEAGGRVWTLWLGSLPVALCGIKPDSLTASSATIWMLATRETEQQPLAFARWTRKYFAEAKAFFPHVTTYHNYAPQDHTKLIIWLRWLGARMVDGDGFVSPFTGDTFIKFEISGG